jgi:hypothetical protein
MKIYGHVLIPNSHHKNSTSELNDNDLADLAERIQKPTVNNGDIKED